jgi:hypothetical protein
MIFTNTQTNTHGKANTNTQERIQAPVLKYNLKNAVLVYFLVYAPKAPIHLSFSSSVSTLMAMRRGPPTHTHTTNA